MVEQFGWRELSVLFGLVGLVLAIRADEKRVRFIFGGVAVLLLVAGVMWPRGVRVVATCYPDYTEVPESVTEDAEGLAEIFDAQDKWIKERGESRFFTRC